MSYQRFLDDRPKHQPFYAVPWMENCYNELAVPNPLIEKLMHNISEKLSAALKGQLDNSAKRQAVFSLLGKQSAKELFPYYRYDESLLAPPHMKPDTRIEILEETQAWLQQQLKTICQELGYDKTMSEGLKDPDLGPFLQQIQNVYESNMSARIQELQGNINEKGSAKKDRKKTENNNAANIPPTIEKKIDKNGEKKSNENDGKKSENKTGVKDGGKTEEKDGGKTEGTNGGKTEVKDGAKTEEKAGNKTEERDGGKTEEKVGGKTEGTNGGKTKEKNGGKTEGTNVGKTKEKDGGKTKDKNGDKTEVKDGDKTEEKAGNKTGEKDGNKTGEKDGNKTKEKAADKTEEKAVDKTEEKVADKIEEKAADKIEEKAVDKIEEKAVDKTEEKDVDKTEVKTGSKSKQKSEVKIKEKSEDKTEKYNEKKSENKGETKPDIDSSIKASGEALLCVGLRDAFKMAQILKILQQRCLPLPGQLRSYIWGEHLFVKEGIRENVVLSNIVVQFRAKFSRIVNRNVSDLQLESATQSAIHKQISIDVKEVYSSTMSLKSLSNEHHILKAAQVLNTIHIYNGSFNPLSIYWLCPLQLCFREAEDSLDNTFNIALHFYLFSSHCPLSQSELFNLAQQVMQSLKQFDPYLHEYLQDVAAKKVKVSNRDFPAECLHQDKLEAKKILNELTLFEGKDLPSHRTALFEDPSIFIRKWLATVFVSALSPFVLMLTWDYIFLDKWEHRRLHDFCIVLLGLLKHWFYRVKDFRGLKQVFFDEPSKLYIADVRKAWLHWQSRGAFDEIPDMNTNITLASTMPDEGGKGA